MRIFFLIFSVTVLINSLFGQKIIETILWEGKEIEIAAGEFGFKLKSEAYKNHLYRILTENNDIELKRPIDINNIGLLKLSTKMDINDQINALYKSGIFLKIFPNVVRRGCGINPDDTYVPNQYAITNMDLREAWEITKGSSNIILSVSDTGIPMESGVLSHPDLNSSRYILGVDEVEDGNGVKDENGHGTHILGIAAATTNNSTGVAGVNWNSPIYICQSLDYTRSGFASDFYESVIDAVNYGANVINYSAGGRNYSEYDEYALDHAANNNVLIVASAGNEYDHAILYPAKLSNSYDNLISVSALTEYDERMGESSFGAEVTLAAPGKYIVSTTPGYSFYEPWQLSYAYVSGTSMSAPYVSGIASLVYSMHPTYTPAQIKQIMIESADDIQYFDGGNIPFYPYDDYVAGIGRDDQTGYGRPNAFKAVSGLRYNLTLHNTAYGKSGLVVGDYVKLWDFAENYVGKVTIQEGMIAPDGYWRWNGSTDDGKLRLASGYYAGLKNGSGNTLHIFLESDVTPPQASSLSFVNNSAFSLTISEYFNVAWVTAFVFDANGGFIRKDFENVISNSGSGKNFSLNQPLLNNQILKIFLIDNAGNIGSVSNQYIEQPLSLNISGPTSLDYNELGYFTANPSGGSGNYTNYRWWSRDDSGIIPESASSNPEQGTSGKDDPIINRPLPGIWIEMTQWEGDQTISKAAPVDFSIKCEVTDSYGNSIEDIHSVNVGGFLLAKSNSNNPDAEQLIIPDEVTLLDNYPNPFNPSTTLKFGLPEDSNISLTIYSVSGQKILTLVEGFYTKGYHEIRWNGRNQTGNSVANGIYVYELRAGSQRFIKKMVFAK